MVDVPALILAGGLGTRLRSVLPDTPKVLARVAGRPFLAYLLDSLADAGVREVILCTGYRAEQVGREFVHATGRCTCITRGNRGRWAPAGRCGKRWR